MKRPGRPARVVVTGKNAYYDAGPNGGGSFIDFRASAIHVALKRASFSSDEFEGDSGGSSLRAGPFDAARLPLVARCYVEGGPRCPARVSATRPLRAAPRARLPSATSPPELSGASSSLPA